MASRRPIVPIKASCKLALFGFLTLILIGPQIVMVRISKGKGAYLIPRLYHTLVCCLLGIRISIQGERSKAPQTIFIANHLSYLDIPVIASLLSTSFVAKKEVASWPLFGTLAKLQQTAFVDRSRSAASREQSSVGAFIRSGKNLVLFAEGTSTDGREVLPSKSSLFSLMLGNPDRPLVLQPLTITMTAVDGQTPDTQKLRDLYSWHRDMDTELPVHLWLFAQGRGAHITLTFHPVLNPLEYGDRKQLAKICHSAVSQGLESAAQMRKVA